MSTKVIEDLQKKVLFVHKDLGTDSIPGKLANNVVCELKEKGVCVVEAKTYEEAYSYFLSDGNVSLVLVEWIPSEKETQGTAGYLVNAIHNRNSDIPVFLCSDKYQADTIKAETLSKFNDFIWLAEDTTNFIAGRIITSIEKYFAQLLPPMFDALVKYGKGHAYSWHTPGHTGGTAFIKHPAGKFFFDFYGENLFRTDISISVGQMGSLLDHNGPIGAGEKYAAKVFGSDRTYYVTNGSSTSNRIITMSSVTKDEVVICDRNCHKSIEHALTMSYSVPTYMVPVRNGLGIIGPILPENFEKAKIEASIKKNALAQKVKNQAPKHLVLTNSTYDGLCYDIEKVEKILGDSIPTLHFDEAWYGYAKFHPLYKGRFAMYDLKPGHKPGPNVFSTHSTHKLLVALSQASYIHVRDGKNPISHERFNESFMMHSSTSPNYAVIASNDVTAAMMKGNTGKVLVEESIREAISFRQMLAKTHEANTKNGGWFFKGWQPDGLHKVDADELATNNQKWLLKPNDAWHGFGNIPEGWVMLDPIKVSIMTPGMSPDGVLADNGIPATIVTRYLSSKGIGVEKTTDFNMLFLFSMGITKGKWGTLISELSNFKRYYDENTSLKTVLPALVESHPETYANMGLKDLCDKMFKVVKGERTTKCMSEAYASLPEAIMTPAEAYAELVRNNVDKLELKDTKGRVAATGVVPYPPGIPILMPGEKMNDEVHAYLTALEKFDIANPGFEHDTHGIEVGEDGKLYMLCLKK